MCRITYRVCEGKHIAAIVAELQEIGVQTTMTTLQSFLENASLHLYASALRESRQVIWDMMSEGETVHEIALMLEKCRVYPSAGFASRPLDGAQLEQVVISSNLLEGLLEVD